MSIGIVVLGVKVRAGLCRIDYRRWISWSWTTTLHTLTLLPELNTIVSMEDRPLCPVWPETEVGDSATYSVG